MKFNTVIRTAGKTATGIEVPPEVVEALGAGKKPAVVVTVNGYTYRKSIAVMNGMYLIALSAEHRTAAGVNGGDKVVVNLELDNEIREVEVPKDFAAALKKSPEAKKCFESLSYSNKSRHVLSIEGAKTEETRQRRIDKSISELEAGK